MFFCVMVLLFILVLVLFWEYRQLQTHIARVQELQTHYESYIASVRMLIANQKKESASDDRLSNQSNDRIPFSFGRLNFNQSTQEALNGFKDEVVCTVSQETKQNSVTRLKTKQKKRPLLTHISFACPMKRSQFWLSSYFGPRKKPNGQWGFHYGLDMAASRGTPIKSVADGVVERAECVSGYGNTIVIAHDEVYKSRYAHLDEILVAVGQRLQQGDLIGKVGDTGFTRKKGKDASHLHLELYENDAQVNPMHLIDI